VEKNIVIYLFKSFQNPNKSKKKLGQLSMPNEESLLPAL